MRNGTPWRCPRGRLGKSAISAVALCRGSARSDRCTLGRTRQMSGLRALQRCRQRDAVGWHGKRGGGDAGRKPRHGTQDAATVIRMMTMRRSRGRGTFASCPRSEAQRIGGEVVDRGCRVGARRRQAEEQRLQHQRGRGKRRDPCSCQGVRTSPHDATALSIWWR
jgi:hypothetical protein